MRQLRLLSLADGCKTHCVFVVIIESCISLAVRQLVARHAPTPGQTTDASLNMRRVNNSLRCVSPLTWNEKVVAEAMVCLKDSQHASCLVSDSDVTFYSVT